ncbi:MAG: AraC family ligand binding domain-containing protein [Acidimicrobiia bacterium]
MRIIRADENPPRAITDWHSRGVHMWGISGFADNAGARVTVGRYDAGSVLGRHPTGSWQAFAVVDGSGWVEGSSGERAQVAAGDLVVWEPAEDHASGSDAGMLVSIVQTTCDPASGPLRG